MIDLPPVSILILNYNGLQWLPRCLSSIKRTEYPHMTVYMVDNGSTDNSVDYVQTNFPEVKIIRNEENLGSAEGYNRGMESIESPYVLLLNCDTEILNPRWIRHLIDKILSDDRIAAVACKMVTMRDRFLDSVGGMGIPFWRGFVDIGKGEVDRGQYDHDDFIPFYFCGGAALIRKDIFFRLGGFDSKLFMFMEDVDYSWRLRLQRYKIGFESKAKVAHHFSGPSEDIAQLQAKDVETWKLYYCHRNLLRIIIRNCGSSFTWALLNYLLFTVLIILGGIFIVPRKTLAVIRALSWNFLNLKETYFHRRKIQSQRVVNDSEILRLMYPQYRRYQSTQHWKLRQILNILFEYSQLSCFYRFSAYKKDIGKS